jgi:hypothetical protein
VPRNLDAVPAKGSGDFHLLWGASFATGDPRYCLKILQQVATVDPWIVEKRGNDKARELSEVAVGIWSLNSNARQHQFVRRTIDDYIAAHPTEPVSKLLQSRAACHLRPC